MKRVRNKSTGWVHEVNDDHWALNHPDYEVLEDEESEERTESEDKSKRKRG